MLMQGSLLCSSPSQGPLIKANTIEAYTSVQEVLLGGWFGSKFIQSSSTDFHPDCFPGVQNITEFVINLALESFLVSAEATQ